MSLGALQFFSVLCNCYIREDLFLDGHVAYTILVRRQVDGCPVLKLLHRENHLHRIVHSPKPLTKKAHKIRTN